MASYENEVPQDVRMASVWNADYGCFEAPDGRCWVWCSPVSGAEVKSPSGDAANVAQWLKDASY